MEPCAPVLHQLCPRSEERNSFNVVEVEMGSFASSVGTKRKRK